MTVQALPPVAEILAALRESTIQHNGEYRRVESRYTLAELSETRQTVVKLTTHHWGDRKVYSTSLQQVTVEQRNGYATESCWLFDNARILTAPIARHSAKAIGAHHARALATLREALELGDEKVLAQFADKDQS